MRVLYLSNNRLGWQILSWLRSQPVEIGGLVLHPPDRRRFGEELQAASGLPPELVFDASRLREPKTLDEIKALNCDIAVSVLFGYILKPEFLSLFPQGVINLHPSLLPYNRGAHPNVWSIVDQTPSGVSLHYIDPGIDTGDLIAQQEVPVTPVDTGASLYARLEAAGLELFSRSWPLIATGQAPRLVQTGEGSSHRVKDLASLDEIDLDRNYTGRELIDLLRARSFPPYHGAYFMAEGRRVYLELKLEYEHEPD